MVVGLLKIFLKLVVLLLLGAAVAGVVMMLNRSSGDTTASFDEWPDVAENPAADV